MKDYKPKLYAVGDTRVTTRDHNDSVSDHARQPRNVVRRAGKKKARRAQKQETARQLDAHTEERQR